MSNEMSFIGFLILCPVVLIMCGFLFGCIWCSRSTREDDE